MWDLDTSLPTLEQFTSSLWASAFSSSQRILSVLVFAFLFIMIQFPTNRISVMYMCEAPQSFWAPSTRWEHKKSEIWKEGLTWPCWHSDLCDFQSPEVWETLRTVLVFVSCHLCCIAAAHSLFDEPVYMLLGMCPPFKAGGVFHSSYVYSQHTAHGKWSSNLIEAKTEHASAELPDHRTVSLMKE